ncbi:hypothetical protein BDC45DRAFT_508952, partial [Circinella umbellata]
MDTTDKELQAEYDARHKNLVHSMHGMFDSVDNALHSAFDEAQERIQGSTAVDNDYAGTSNVTNTSNPLTGNTTTTATRRSRSSTSSNVQDQAQATADDIKAEHRKHSFGFKINKSAMDATRRDIDALREADAERFEPVGSKIEDTLGNTALVDDSLDSTGQNKGAI